MGVVKKILQDKNKEEIYLILLIKTLVVKMDTKNKKIQRVMIHYYPLEVVQQIQMYPP